MTLLVRSGAALLAADERLDNAWLLVREGVIAEVGDGPPPAADETLDLRHCVVSAGLVNTHDHMYQWATRGYAQESGLFEWLKLLYPIWANIDAEIVRAAARAAIGRLLLAGCTLTSDHHYIFPVGRPGIFEALVDAARDLGIRFHPARGSMSLGASAGGLPPDSLVEDEDEILADTERLASRYHDARPGSMLRVAVAPCSPFSVTPRLMEASAQLARRLGLQLHTHLAETLDEDTFCVAKFGHRPLEMLSDWGWLGGDVWLAHGIHFDDVEIAHIGRSRTGIAHCPSSNMRLGAGACRARDLVRAGARVGLGVDGAASSEDYDLLRQPHQALLLARVRAAFEGSSDAASAMSPTEAWALATSGGAAVLGRDDLGSLRPGLRADIAAYRLDDLGRAGLKDPVAALTLAPPARAEVVLVEGRVVVRDARLVNAEESDLARDVAAAAARLRRAVHA